MLHVYDHQPFYVCLYGFTHHSFLLPLSPSLFSLSFSPLPPSLSPFPPSPSLSLLLSSLLSPPPSSLSLFLQSFLIIHYIYVHCILHYNRLLPYGCISTGARVGFIQCVTQAETIANIQKMLKSTKSKLTLWDSTLLYQWLKDKSPTEQQYVPPLFYSILLFLYHCLLIFFSPSLFPFLSTHSLSPSLSSLHSISLSLPLPSSLSLPPSLFPSLPLSLPRPPSLSLSLSPPPFLSLPFFPVAFF